MSAVYLETQNLNLSYSRRPALVDLSLQFPANQLTAIIGPSGCGKTSLLCALNGLTDLVPYCAITGQILLQGASINQLDRTELRRRVGKIFQKANPFPMSIRRNLSLPLNEHRFPKSEIEPRVEAALRRVGLWPEVADRLDHDARSLSGGQQQRLCLARALALEPQALLLDEPCSALDPRATATIEELLLELRGAYTLIVVTHNLAQAQRIADHVTLLWNHGDGGFLVETNTKPTFFENPSEPLTQSYLHEASLQTRPPAITGGSSRTDAHATGRIP